MPSLIPATDPAALLAGAYGPSSRAEFLALMIEGSLSRPRISTVTPGLVNHAGAGATHTFLGRELIPVGWRQSRLTVDLGPANSALEWIAVQPGVAGGALHIRYVDNGGATAVGYAGGVVTVGFNVGAGGDTANNIIAALAASGTGAQYQVMARNVFGSTGAGKANAAFASTPLAGGTGEALQRAALVVNPVANGAIAYAARNPGTPGNDISVEYAVGLAPGDLPVVTVTDKAIVIQITAGATTANDILRAYETSTTARALASATLVYGQTGAGIIPGAVATANLTGGGDGTAVSAVIGGLAGDISAVWDNEVAVYLAPLAGSVATDMALAEIRICGFYHAIWMVVV